MATTTINGDLEAPSGITVGGTSDKIHKIFTATTANDIGALGANAVATVLVTVAGVDNTKDSAVLVSCQSTLSAGLVLSGRVSGSNEVQMDVLNTHSSSVDQAQAEYYIVVFQLEA